MFFSIIHLGAGKNAEGYDHALIKTWRLLLKRFESFPHKSSLSRARARVSYRFFKDIFESIIDRFNRYRPAWKGLHLYAIDGDEFDLPCSEQVLERGYTGRSLQDETETYYPKMYVTHLYDILACVSKDLRLKRRHTEFYAALEMMPDLEADSLTTYDRLFLCGDLVKAHHKAGNYFLARRRS